MINENKDNVCIYCFVFFSSLILWVSSIFLLPYDYILHMLNFVGIIFHFLYYLYFCKIVLFFYMIYMTFFTFIHYVYILQIGFYVFQSIVVIHLVILWILIYTHHFTELFIALSIIAEMLTRNIYIATYLLLSYSHPIFLFSGYTKTK